MTSSSQHSGFTVSRGGVLGQEVNERWVRAGLGITWGLLFLNVLGFQRRGIDLPDPGLLGKSITQGALLLGLLMALTVNLQVYGAARVFSMPRGLLVIEALVTSLVAQALQVADTSPSTCSLVIVLWMLSRWWGRRDLG